MNGFCRWVDPGRCRRRALFGSLALLTALLAGAGCLHPPLFWSPDGEWLTYAVGNRDARSAFPSGWLFQTSANRFAAEPKANDARGAERRRNRLKYRIWATRASDRLSLPLEESDHPLTSPGWKPDGSQLAFGRIVFDKAGQSGFEIVVQEGPTERRVIATEPIPRAELDAEIEAADLPALSIAWSRDGEWLAVPRFRPKGLAIVRASGGVAATLDDGYFPAWSPAEAGGVAYLKSGDSDSLYYWNARSNTRPRMLCDLGPGPAFCAPEWSRDGKSISIARRRSINRSSEQIELLRVFLNEPRIQVVKRLLREPATADRPILAASFALSRDSAEVFTVVQTEGEGSEIVWSKPRRGAKSIEDIIYKRIPLLDPTIPIGAVSLSPTERKLAVRGGAPNITAPPAVYDLTTDDLELLAPDDSTRIEWLAILVGSARKLIDQAFPAQRGGSATSRPALLPLPKEPMLDPSFSTRLRKIGRAGKALCERPSVAAATDADSREVLAEAAVFFNYLAGDYDSAWKALDAVEARMSDREGRLRCLGLRAQIATCRGRKALARSILDAIEAGSPRSVSLLEESPAGVALRPVALEHEWIAALRSKSTGPDTHGEAADDADEETVRAAVESFENIFQIVDPNPPR